MQRYGWRSGFHFKVHVCNDITLCLNQIWFLASSFLHNQGKRMEESWVFTHLVQRNFILEINLLFLWSLTGVHICVGRELNISRFYLE